MMPEALDVLKAYKALHAAPWLSPAARRVGFAIVDSFNKKTGQCDPSQGRLADLLSLEVRTVKRAVQELTRDEDGRPALFHKVSHGGGYHQASYGPLWDRLRALSDEWDALISTRFEPVEDDPNGTKMSPLTGQKCPNDGDKNVPQTYRRTFSKEPVETSKPENATTEKAETPRGSGIGEMARKEIKSLARSFRQPSSPSHQDVANNRAADRIDKKLRSFGADFYATAIDRIDVTLWASAIDRETSRAGSGSRLILETLAGTA